MRNQNSRNADRIKRAFEPVELSAERMQAVREGRRPDLQIGQKNTGRKRMLRYAGSAAVFCLLFYAVLYVGSGRADRFFTGYDRVHVEDSVSYVKDSDSSYEEEQYPLPAEDGSGAVLLVSEGRLRIRAGKGTKHQLLTLRYKSGRVQEILRNSRNTGVARCDIYQEGNEEYYEWEIAGLAIGQLESVEYNGIDYLLD